MPTDLATPATRFQRSPRLEIQFPPLPKTVREVSSIVGAAEVPDTRRLAELVHADLVTAALVLRRINSAYYGLRRRFSNVKQAVGLLGFLEVCDIVLTAGMLKLRDVLRSEEQLVIFDRIMYVSMGCAFYARHLATALDLPARDSAFTVGLLHAIGRLVLLYNRPDDYEALWYTKEDGLAPEASAERIIFGVDHAEVGALAAEQWNLPVVIAETIRSYLEPGHAEERDVRLLALTLAVSTSVSEQLYLQAEHDAEAAIEPPSALGALADEVQQAPEEILELLHAERPRFYAYISAMG